MVSGTHTIPTSLGVPCPWGSLRWVNWRKLCGSTKITSGRGFGPPLRDDVPQRGWEVDRLGVNVWGSKALEGGYLPSLRGRLPETNRQKKTPEDEFSKIGSPKDLFFRWENVGFRECICIYIYNYLLVEIPGKYSPVKWHSWLENGHNLKMYVLLKINMFPLLC